MYSCTLYSCTLYTLHTYYTLYTLYTHYPIPEGVDVAGVDQLGRVGQVYGATQDAY